MKANEKWTTEAWSAIKDIYADIIASPFIVELASGKLSPESFSRYIAQDELYLGNYGLAMFRFADMIADAAQREMFRAFAQMGLDGEKAMHSIVIERFGINTVVNPSQVTLDYNQHTTAALDTGSKEIALAAMLPCMWIYNEVGLHILKIASLDTNPYKEWIKEYGNEEFTQGVNQVLDLINGYAAVVTDDIRQKMLQTFMEASRYELDFWNYGYNG